MVISVGAPSKCPLVPSNLSLSGWHFTTCESRLGGRSRAAEYWWKVDRPDCTIAIGPVQRRFLSMSFRPGSYLLPAEGIAERYAKARHPRPREFDVVMDSVIMRLRPEENVVPEIKTNAAADVAQEMVGGREIRAGDEGTGEERLIKPRARNSDSSLQLERRLFPQRWRVNSIEVIKDGTKRL